jgi:hypothetical protein
MSHQFTLFTFPSNYYALKAEKAVQNTGLQARLIPMPRELSSLCGLALELEAAAEKQALAILSAAVKLEKKVRVIKKKGLITEIVHVSEYE